MKINFARNAKNPFIGNCIVPTFSLIYENITCGKIWHIHLQFLKQGQWHHLGKITWGYLIHIPIPKTDSRPTKSRFGGTGPWNRGHQSWKKHVYRKVWLLLGHVIMQKQKWSDLGKWIINMSFKRLLWILIASAVLWQPLKGWACLGCKPLVLSTEPW